MNSQDVDDGRDREAEEPQVGIQEPAFRRFGELAALAKDSQMMRGRLKWGG